MLLMGSNDLKMKDEKMSKSRMAEKVEILIVVIPALVPEGGKR